MICTFFSTYPQLNIVKRQAVRCTIYGASKLLKGMENGTLIGLMFVTLKTHL